MFKDLIINVAYKIQQNPKKFSGNPKDKGGRFEKFRI